MHAVVSRKLYEPTRSTKSRVGEPLSVVVFVTTPTNLALVWASVLRQTHRPIEFIVYNASKNPKTIREVHSTFKKIAADSYPGVDFRYRVGVSRVTAMRSAKYQRLLIVPQTSQLEPGHIESLYETKRLTGKRGVSSVLHLGEYGGFDSATIEHIRAADRQSNLRLGMFIMTKREIAAVRRNLQMTGYDKPFNLGAEFLRVYWRMFLSGGRSVGTRLPTHIAAFVKA